MEQEFPLNGRLREKAVVSFLKLDTYPLKLVELTTLRPIPQSYVLLELFLLMQLGIASLALSATVALIQKILQLSARQVHTKIYQDKPLARVAQPLHLMALNTTRFTELPHAKFVQQAISAQVLQLCLSSAHGVNTQIKAVQAALIVAHPKAGFASLAVLCLSRLNQSVRRDFTAKKTHNYHHRQASLSL